MINIKYSITIAAISFIVANSLFGAGYQSRPKQFRSIVSRSETISMSGSMSFDKAIEIFNGLSKVYLGKMIIDADNHRQQIGVNIDNLPWREGLEMILKRHSLNSKEYKDYILITKKVVTASETVPVDEEFIVVEDREVIISALFFEANITKISQMGSSWRLKKDGSDNFSVNMSSGDNKASLLQLSSFNNMDFGNITGVFKAMANSQLGEILASPQITVRSNTEGRIQIGSDFSVTVQDFSGNTVSQFFSTGSIISVLPKVISRGGQLFIAIELEAQKSSATSSELGIEIKKVSAKTSLILIDGEETTIGGLYSTEESTTIDGVPILKDLPWWFFGLRYIFGFESKRLIRKELIIILKAELVPSLEERLAEMANGNRQKGRLERSMQQFDEIIENYKLQTDRAYNGLR